MNAYIVIYAGYGIVVYIDCILQLLSDELTTFSLPQSSIF